MVAVAAPAPPTAAPRPTLVLEEIAPTTAPVEAPTAPALAVFLATSPLLLSFAPLASAARMQALMSASACCSPTLLRWSLGYSTGRRAVEQPVRAMTKTINMLPAMVFIFHPAKSFLVFSCHHSPSWLQGQRLVRDSVSWPINASWSARQSCRCCPLPAGASGRQSGQRSVLLQAGPGGPGSRRCECGPGCSCRCLQHSSA